MLVNTFLFDMFPSTFVSIDLNFKSAKQKPNIYLYTTQT